MMRFSSFQVNSLFIDRIGNRWISRGLFLFVLTISIAMNLWPIGDADFSKVSDWLNTYSSSSLPASATIASFPTITAGNVEFLLFTYLMIFAYIFISVVYAHFYVGDRTGLTVSQSVRSLVSRLPALIGFFLIIIIVSIFLSVFFAFSYLFIIPAMFLSPILILAEKKNPFQSISFSFRYTNGYKFSIFWNLLTIYCLFRLADWIVFNFLPDGSNAGILLHGFFTAFAVLTIGRTIGIFYEMIRIGKEIRNTEQEK